MAPTTPLAATHTICPLGPDEQDELLWVDHAAFVFPQDPDSRLDHFEWDRTFGVRSGPQAGSELIGVSTTFSLRLTLPEWGVGDSHAVVPMAGLSWVAVHPGHRRRGVLTTLIRDHLHRLHEENREPISGLYASEPAIYGRFGYGLATVGLGLTVNRGAALRPLTGSDDVALRFTSADPARDVALIAELHSRACTRRPGMVDRTEALTRDLLTDTPRQLQRTEPLRLLMAERDGVPTGYALLRRTVDWKDGIAQGTADVVELVAVDAITEHRLWRAVTDFDLTSTTTTSGLALDDPLLTWLVDPRVTRPRRVDRLWLRLVDVDRALTARRYAHDVDVVLEVTDALCPWNERRWRLAGGPHGATCQPTSQAADLMLDVRELGAALPGGTTLAALARAGLVREERPGALVALSTALRSPVEPATTVNF